MAKSWVSVCNSALTKLGDALIVSLDDATPQAKLCRERYEECRDIVLSMHPWNCATTRVVLAPLTEVPVFEYTHKFQLPSDCLRVLSINDTTVDEDWRIEGRTLLINKDLIELKYIRRIEDPNELDTLAAESIATYLAADICYTLKQDDVQKQALQQAFAKTIKTAKFVNAVQSSQEAVEARYFVDRRYGGSVL